FEWTNATLFHGLYQRLDSFWENTEMQASGPLEGEELDVLQPYRDRLASEIFSEPAYVPPFYVSGQQLDRAANREASRLLEEAGWEVGEDGMRRNAAGELLTVELVDDQPTFERVALPFVANLRRIGI